MIYSLILVAIDSKSDLGLQREKFHSLRIQAQVPVPRAKHGWLGKAVCFDFTATTAGLGLL